MNDPVKRARREGCRRVLITKDERALVSTEARGRACEITAADASREGSDSLLGAGYRL